MFNYASLTDVVGMLLFWALGLYVLTRSPRGLLPAFAAATQFAVALYLFHSAMLSNLRGVDEWQAWGGSLWWAGAVAPALWYWTSVIVLRHEAQAILSKVGHAAGDTLVELMSGGELRRVALARMLVASPDLAVLDEPTNHLDVPAIEWLERLLVERFEGALILVTHDRYFLNRVATHILAFETNGAVHFHHGDYESYREWKLSKGVDIDARTGPHRKFHRA